MKKLLLLVLLCTLTINSQGKELRVYLDWFHNIEFAGMFLAIDKGWYKEKGIELKLVFKDLNIIERVIDNEAHVGMHSANELIKYVAKGHLLKAIAAKYQINPNCIVTGKDVQKLSDLKNKVIGVLSPQEYELHNVMFKQAGLALSDVTFKQINTFNERKLLELLRSNTIDALVAWEFNWTVTFSLLGFETRVFPGYDYGFHYYGIVYFTTDQFLKQNESTLKDFLEVTFRGWREVYKDPDAAARWVVEKWHPKDKFILGSQKLTLKQQILELKLRQKYLFQGVDSRYIGLMSKFYWQKSIEISKNIGILPKESSIRPKDLYDNSLILEVINRTP